MQEKKKTVYCGSGRKHSETWIKATINVDKIQEFIEEFKGTRFVRLSINVKDAPDQFGKDVSLTIDQFEPDQSKTQKSEEPKKPIGNIERRFQDEALDNMTEDSDFPL